MEFLFEYGLFLAKAATVIIAFGIITGIAFGLSGYSRNPENGKINILHINGIVEEMRNTIQTAMLGKEALKTAKKARKKEEKDRHKKQAAEYRKRIYVINFNGGIQASEVSQLREEITAVLTVATAQDEVIVRLESGGGAAHSYGLAASQLDRIRKKEIPLTICVDKIAASGGYMMACVANRILCAPFALVGSIGVIGQVPNFHRLLKKHSIDIEQHTAGEYKRTLTLLGENTEVGREKFQEDLKELHTQFKNHISKYRQQLDIDKIATGKVWSGCDAKELGLVDDILTSDEYLVEQISSADLYEVTFVQQKRLWKKIGLAVEGSLERAVIRCIQRLSSERFLTLYK